MNFQLTLHSELTHKQRKILQDKADFLILRGPAGTSKTYIALARALKALQKKEISKIIIIRSAVEIRKIGFLPGDQQEKIDVYADPYRHLFEQLSPKRNYRSFVSAGDLEFLCTSYLRGTTFDDSFVIVDEYQNMSAHELETIATRVGDKTQMVLCGDLDQSDLPKYEAEDHLVVMQTLHSMEEVSTHTFGIEDIVRSGFVKRYYEAKQSAF
jgi:phosphate starvation-inducible PhoH-like protein